MVYFVLKNSFLVSFLNPPLFEYIETLNEKYRSSNVLGILNADWNTQNIASLTRGKSIYFWMPRQGNAKVCHLRY
jgi:hypothetical protein